MNINNQNTDNKYSINNKPLNNKPDEKKSTRYWDYLKGFVPSFPSINGINGAMGRLQAIYPFKRNEIEVKDIDLNDFVIIENDNLNNNKSEDLSNIEKKDKDINDE